MVKRVWVEKNKILVVSLLVIVILLGISKPWKAHAQGVTKVADLPFPLYNACSALASDGNIYIFGGQIYEINQYPASSSVIRFNPEDKSVTIVADLGNGYKGGWAVSYNNKIYVGSGIYGTQTSNIFIFDPSDNSINTVTPPSSMKVYSGGSGHGNIGAFLYNNKIYVFFGYRYSAGQGTVKIYDINNNTATTARISDPIIYYSVSSYNNLAYIVGWKSGQNNTGVLVYNPISNTLIKEAEFSYWAGMATCFGADNKMYAFGGHDYMPPRNLKSDIIKYDPISKTYVLAGSLPVPRSSSCATLANNGKIYLIGGLDSYEAALGNPTTDILEIDPSALSAPPGDFFLSGALNDYEADLTWTTSTNAIDYILERSSDGNNFTQINQTSGNAYTDPDLSPGTYYYRVKAQNINGTRLSNTVIITVQQLVPEEPVLSVTLNGTDADLSWTSVSEATKYILERSTDGKNFTQIKQTSGNAYTDPDLSPGTYYYQVKAQNSSGTSTPSNIVSVTIQYIPPARFWVFWPSGGQYVQIDWTRGNINLSGDMVQLWREDTVAGMWMPVKDISESEKDSFIWNDTNVMSGLNYKYQIRVYEPSKWDWRIAAESDWAAQDRPFPAPSGLRVTSTADTSATITWTPITGATRYELKISTDNGLSWQSSTTSGPPVTVPKPCILQIMAGTHARSQWSGILRVE